MCLFSRSRSTKSKNEQSSKAQFTQDIFNLPICIFQNASNTYFRATNSPRGTVQHAPKRTNFGPKMPSRVCSNWKFGNTQQVEELLGQFFDERLRE